MCQLKIAIIFNFQVTSKEWREVSNFAKYKSYHWVSLDKKTEHYSFWVIASSWEDF